MNLTPIRDVIQKTRQLDPKKLGRDSFVYVDISSIDKNAKRIVEPQTLLVDEAPSRARKEIKANDVLVATVRPNLNGVAIVPPEYNNQIASTGFCVLRSDTEQLDPNYLFYFTQTDYFISHLTELSTGAGYPAVSDEDILDTRIPLPPLTEQKRIASLLARADRLRHLRRTARDLGESLLQSVFLEMFGDPRTNPKKWKVEKVGKHIKSIRYGTGSPPDYHENGIPFIRATNVKQGTIKLQGMVYISEEDAKNISKCQISEGDLIIVRSGVNSGDCALVPPEYDGAYAAYDLIVEVPFPTNQFLNTVINSPFGKETIATLSRRAGQPHVNSEQIESMEYPFPPLNLQEEFAGVVARVEALRGRMAESERQVEGLFESLLAQAFEGK